MLHTYPADYKVVFVGDAAMSPYEIVYPGGSVEHYNQEPGEVWLRRFLATYPSSIWLNPLPEGHWDYYQSAQMIKEVFEDRMYPMTLDGLDAAMRELSR